MARTSTPSRCVVGRIPNPDAPGRELVVLRTEPSAISGLQVAPAHTLMPATPQEVLLRLRLDIHNALEQALFFGARREELRAAVAAELQDALAASEVRAAEATNADASVQAAS
ncbi:MAG: hypothetical protein H7Y32_12480 [Chloroflexales bacterium]|nr:hypothetical protein [Chloroflexales bacterium]